MNDRSLNFLEFVLKESKNSLELSNDEIFDLFSKSDLHRRLLNKKDEISIKFSRKPGPAKEAFRLEGDEAYRFSVVINLRAPGIAKKLRDFIRGLDLFGDLVEDNYKVLSWEVSYFLNPDLNPGDYTISESVGVGEHKKRTQNGYTLGEETIAEVSFNYNTKEQLIKIIESSLKEIFQKMGNSRVAGRKLPGNLSILLKNEIKENHKKILAGLINGNDEGLEKMGVCDMLIQIFNENPDQVFFFEDLPSDIKGEILDKDLIQNLDKENREKLKKLIRVVNIYKFN